MLIIITTTIITMAVSIATKATHKTVFGVVSVIIPVYKVISATEI